MTSILLVKSSSLGDVVHNLPVASDISGAFPGAKIDWVVEEHFAPIPRAHPGVRRVLPVAIRRWRRMPWRARFWDEVAAFTRALRAERYDAVIDTQGLLKSALITRAARGTRYGLDWRSSREPLGVFYHQSFSVPRAQHAVQRNRTLAAQALKYVLEPEVDYGIRASPGHFAWLTRDRYAVMIHSTSAAAKLWPEAQWVEVGRTFARRGVTCVLPWGSSAERERSVRIAEGVEGGIVPPQLGLDEAMALLAGAQFVIGVDTGLTHLAAALGVSTVAVFCATDPARTGVYGCKRAANVGSVGMPPQAQDIERVLESLRA